MGQDSEQGTVPQPLTKGPLTPTPWHDEMADDALVWFVTV